MSIRDLDDASLADRTLPASDALPQSRPDGLRVLKFGGTSVATADAIRQLIRIVTKARTEGPVVVVVSAFGGVTNALLAAADTAAAHDLAYADQHAALVERHLEMAEALAPDEAESLRESLETRLGDLGDLLHGVYLLRECSPRTRDGVVSYGERCSAEVVAAAMRAAGLEAVAHDARQSIVTDASFGRAQVDFDATRTRLRAALLGEGTEAAGLVEAENSVETVIPVVTGFVAATPEGQTTTLGRGGSDYTAAILGASLDASVIELWTDVDGVLSTDPRVVSEAFPQTAMSYSELMELSHFGAKVVYPPSIHPARRAGIPLRIKNTFNPDAPGTLITGDEAPNTHAIRGLASVDSIALLRLEGDGMVGVPGIAGRLFGALARAGVSVILISQGSSEHSICFAVAPGDTEAARRAVAEEFVLEQRAGLVDALVAEEDQAVVAAVGAAMHERPGLAGRLFSVLGRHGVNVKTIAQGSSELNISLVVDRDDGPRALRAVHGAFFHPRRRRLSVALAGVGRVGSVLLDQIRDTAPRLRDRFDLEVEVVALASSKHLLIDRDGIDLETWRAALEGAPAPRRDALFEGLSQPAGDLRVFVDCTASDGMVALYERLLGRGIGVVAANKRPFAGPLADFRALEDAARSGAALYHEATVGAGLPVLSTLGDLVLSGDRVRTIDGILSGTLNAVLERVGAGKTLSTAVRSAYDDGLTEPHPWDDLSGGDVARKLCILARLAGWELEPEAIEVEPLLPGDGWGAMDLDTFWNELPSLDDGFGRRQAEATAAGRRLRYVGHIAGEGVRVGLQAVGPEHPAFSLAGPDNLVAFATERYSVTPLVIQGPGAGPEVTAAGVLADVLKAADRLQGVGEAW